MKTQFNSSILILVRVIAIVALTLMAALHGFAQWRPQGRNFFVGLETSNSSRAFSLISDQAHLSGVHILQGKKYGVIYGIRAITGKVRVGDYTTSQKEAPLKANGYELISNFQPLQFFEEKQRLLEPYITIALEGTTLHTSGMYTPPPAAKNNTSNSSGSGSNCSCTCPNSPPSPPAPKSDPGPTPYSGKVVTTRGNVGVGLKLHIEKSHMFIDVFTEYKYGIALGNTSSTQALLNTYSLGQKGIDVGVSIGFVKNKAATKLRRTGFR